ncbi:MAG TPA: hypothetical protein GXZ21_04915 [Clostridiales bacterium]|nr:hypothetical protein [Clostridiales bacterium]
MAETFLMINKEFELLLRIITDKKSFLLPYHAEVIEEEEVGTLFNEMEEKGIISRVEESVSPDNTLALIIKDMADAQAIIGLMNNQAMIYVNQFVVLLSRDERREIGLRLTIYESIKELLSSDDMADELHHKCICHFVSANKTLEYKTLEMALKSKIFNSQEKESENRNAFID